jgi:hypothetical protein
LLWDITLAPKTLEKKNTVLHTKKTIIPHALQGAGPRRLLRLAVDPYKANTSARTKQAAEQYIPERKMASCTSLKTLSNMLAQPTGEQTAPLNDLMESSA